MKEKRWQIQSRLKGRDLASSQAVEDEVIELLLGNRGIVDKEEFFNPPEPSNLVKDPSHYLPDLDQKQLKKAVERIKTAVKAREKIVVWGDYDVDGVTSTAILWQTLDTLGAKALPYIPDRFTEGYGLNKEGIKKLSEQGFGLIVTVDSGITAREEVGYANSLGLQVIVTDHHLKPKKLPSAHSIIHTDHLCGAGIVWLLTRYLDPRPSALDNDLDLVAIATVADLQPLLGINRSLVKCGFKVLNRNERPGLAALIEVAGLKPGNLGSYAAGWIIGPRINAVGRLEQGIEALRLLCTKERTKAKELAHLLEAANLERRALTVETFNHAKDLTDGRDDLTILYHDSWHEGIIGLVAGKLVEEYGRPAVVIARGDEFSKGSARSVNGFNILEVLRKQIDFLEDVGGHAMAAGFTVLNEKLDKFVVALRKEAAEKLKDLDPRPTLKIDLELPLQALSYGLVRELAKLAPHGVGNPEPLFVAREVNVLEERRVGRQKQHLKLMLSPGFEAIWFGHGEDGGFTLGEEISIVYTPEIEVWNGKERVTLKIRDLRKANHE